MYAAAAPPSERAGGVGVRLVIICFRVSDPDNGTTDVLTEGKREGGREGWAGWHWHLAEHCVLQLILGLGPAGPEETNIISVLYEVWRS